MLIGGRTYYAVPQNYLANVGGDVRPVYAILCGEAGGNRLTVPQNYRETIAGDTRPVVGTGSCLDGQFGAGTVVVAVPQGYTANVGGDVRPVYAFVCCPPGSSSSSSSGGILTECCAGIEIPETLYVTFAADSGDCSPIIGQTVQLTYQFFDAGGIYGWLGSFPIEGGSYCFGLFCCADVWRLLNWCYSSLLDPDCGAGYTRNVGTNPCSAFPNWQSASAFSCEPFLIAFDPGPLAPSCASSCSVYATVTA